MMVYILNVMKFIRKKCIIYLYFAFPTVFNAGANNGFAFIIIFFNFLEPVGDKILSDG